MSKELYQEDNRLQRAVANVTMIGYVVFSVALLIVVITISHYDLDLPDWAVALVSSIWGAWSTMAANVVAYFFGDSQSAKQKDRTLHDISKEVAPKNQPQFDPDEI